MSKFWPQGREISTFLWKYFRKMSLALGARGKPSTIVYRAGWLVEPPPQYFPPVIWHSRWHGCRSFDITTADCAPRYRANIWHNSMMTLSNPNLAQPNQNSSFFCVNFPMSLRFAKYFEHATSRSCGAGFAMSAEHHPHFHGARIT